MTILDKLFGDDPPKKKPAVANEDINLRPMPKYDFQNRVGFNPWITASDDPDYRIPDSKYMDTLLNKAIKSQKDRDNFWFGLNTNPNSKFSPELFKTRTDTFEDGTVKTVPNWVRPELVVKANGWGDYENDVSVNIDPDYERFMRTFAPVGLKDPRVSNGLNEVAFSNNVGEPGGERRQYNFTPEPYSYKVPKIDEVDITGSKIFPFEKPNHTPVEPKLLKADVPIWKEIWKPFEWRPFDDQIAVKKKRSLFDMIKDFPFAGMSGIA